MSILKIFVDCKNNNYSLNSAYLLENVILTSATKIPPKLIIELIHEYGGVIQACFSFFFLNDWLISTVINVNYFPNRNFRTKAISQRSKFCPHNFIFPQLYSNFCWKVFNLNSKPQDLLYSRCTFLILTMIFNLQNTRNHSGPKSESCAFSHWGPEIKTSSL